MKKFKKQIISCLLAITMVLSLTNVIAPIMSKAADPVVLEDGKYTIEVDTGADMFKVVYAEIEVKNGKMVADIALSGQGYDYLHMGTKLNVTEAGKIGYTVKKVPVDGKMVEKYVYSGIPVSALDEAIAITSHSKKYTLLKREKLHLVSIQYYLQIVFWCGYINCTQQIIRCP